MKDYREYYKAQIEKILSAYCCGYGEFLRKRYQNYKYICIWGAGNMGRALPQLLKEVGVTVNFYCDNDKGKVGMNVHNYGIECISLEELLKVRNETAVIVPTRYYKEIHQQLQRLEFPLVDRVFHAKFIVDAFLMKTERKQVIATLQKVIDSLADEESCRVLFRLVEEWTTNEYRYGQLDDICSLPQYFPKELMPCEPEEVFVDCGAYNGDNIADFMEFTGETFRKYYAFELNRTNCIELQQNVHNKWLKWEDQFVIENKGISDKTGIIHYIDACEGSKLNEDGKEEGYVTALDDYFGENEKVTFIKMDIEGAEMSALQGAAKTISRCMPKLAICIYHKPEDFWEIPMYIKQNWEQYDIYIRHHTELTTETVCYAIPQNKDKRLARR